jgi:hypothetical protein
MDGWAILRDARGEAAPRRGVQAHRLACAACALGRTATGARTLAELERRAIAWADPAGLAQAAGVTVDEWLAHLWTFGLDEAQRANLEGAAAAALALALAGDTQAARVALSALDRLREARGLPRGGAGGATDPGQEPEDDPAAWPGEDAPAIG